MLEVNDINVYYGAIHAVKGISLTVGDGEIVTLIGSNGAGKTTTLQTISGILTPKTGSIKFDGEELVGVPAHKIVGKGLVQVPEGRHVFSNMSVMENLDMGAYLRKDKDGIEKDRKRVFELFPRLYERRSQMAGTLSGGEQQMLAMGRALMSRPKTLLMDEPSMGLAPLLVKEIFSIIRNIHEEGTTVSWKQDASSFRELLQKWQPVKKSARLIWAAEETGRYCSLFVHVSVDHLFPKKGVALCKSKN